MRHLISQCKIKVKIIFILLLFTIITYFLKEILMEEISKFVKISIILSSLAIFLDFFVLKSFNDNINLPLLIILFTICFVERFGLFITISNYMTFKACIVCLNVMIWKLKTVQRQTYNVIRGLLSCH